MDKSKRFTLNQEDIKKWAKNTLLFSAPTIIAFLTVLQSGGSFEFAMGAGYSALLSSLIDLTKKFVQE